MATDVTFSFPNYKSNLTMSMFRFKQQSMISTRVPPKEPVIYRRRSPLPANSLHQQEKNGRSTWKELKAATMKTLLQWKRENIAWKKLFNNGNRLKKQQNEPSMIESLNIPLKFAAWQRQELAQSNGKLLRILC